MNSFEIAKNQLSRLNEFNKKSSRKRKIEVEPKSKRGRKPIKAPEGDAGTVPEGPEDQSIIIQNNNLPTEIDSYTIQWDVTNVLDIDEVPVQVVHDVPSVAKVIKKKMIWDPHTKVVVSSVESEETAVPSPPKKKRSEVDKLLGDEGVQTIMRDQHIALDDNGLLVNIQKASKTRHQRSRQEEPEKTPNDWNMCSMIVRRRSSVSSTESQHIQTEPEDVQESTPPKITDLFQTMKAKINQSLQDNFDSIVVLNPDTGKKKQKEKNNNEVVVAKKVGRPSKQAANGKAKAPPPPPITIQTVEIPVNSETAVFQVKFEPRPRDGPNAPFLSGFVCKRLVEALSGVLQRNSCKLVLLGPIKFPALENVKISSEDEAEQRNLLEFLTTFPMPIIVAVQGHVDGVGVTMLPLFDLVYAKYGTEFCCTTNPLPGISILMNSAKVDKNRISEMLFLDESVTSTQAANCGLITKEISSKNDKEFEEKVMQVANDTVERKHTERMRVLKKLWSESHLETLIRDLNRETTV